VARGSLAELAVGATGPHWSPSGDRIAYATQTGPALINSDGSGTRTYPEPYIGYGDVTLEWSPGGRWLITRRRGPLTLGDLESGERVPLPYMGGAYQPS
jgi:Tol biopolymer transport system component